MHCFSTSLIGRGFADMGGLDIRDDMEMPTPRFSQHQDTAKHFKPATPVLHLNSCSHQVKPSTQSNDPRLVTFCMWNPFE